MRAFVLAVLATTNLTHLLRGKIRPGRVIVRYLRMGGFPGEELPPSNLMDCFIVCWHFGWRRIPAIMAIGLALLTWYFQGSLSFGTRGQEPVVIEPMPQVEEDINHKKGKVLLLWKLICGQKRAANSHQRRTIAGKQGRQWLNNCFPGSEISPLRTRSNGDY